MKFGFKKWLWIFESILQGIKLNFSHWNIKIYRILPDIIWNSTTITMLLNTLWFNNHVRWILLPFFEKIHLHFWSNPRLQVEEGSELLTCLLLNSFKECWFIVPFARHCIVLHRSIEFYLTLCEIPQPSPCYWIPFDSIIMCVGFYCPSLKRSIFISDPILDFRSKRAASSWLVCC